MSEVGSWLLSIVGVVIIGALIDIILPDSSISKYIKSIYAFFIIFVIINPILNLQNISVNFDEEYKNYIDSEYVEVFNDQTLSFIKENIESQAYYSGLEGVNITIVAHYSANKLIIEKVTVFLENVVIRENFEHIDKYQLLDQIIVQNLKIDKEDICYYEWEEVFFR